MALGAVGLVGAFLFTGLPALCAGTKYNKCINACCYSVCAGVFSLFFIGAGAGFIVIGVAIKGPIGDELLAECAKQASGAMSSEMESSGDAKMDAAADDMVDCAADSMCRGFIKIIDDIGASSTMIGIPYFLAGITMFVGCYIGCCCKKSVPQVWVPKECYKRA